MQKYPKAELCWVSCEIPILQCQTLCLQSPSLWISWSQKFRRNFTCWNILSAWSLVFVDTSLVLMFHFWLQSCTGHATHILQMHAIFTESQSLDDLYVVSLAQDDRVISLWKPQGTGKRCKRAIASFLLSDEPQQSSLFYDQVWATLSLQKEEQSYSLVLDLRKTRDAVLSYPFLNSQFFVTHLHYYGQAAKLDTSFLSSCRLACSTMSGSVLIRYLKAACFCFELE